MNTINDTAIKKLKLLFTVVERQKAEFYLDVLSQYDVNCQLVVSGKGTATSEIVDLLGLNNQKAVLLSILREDRTDDVMNMLEKKFATIRNGKGIAFAVPMSSVIGVNLYQFLATTAREGECSYDNK